MDVLTIVILVNDPNCILKYGWLIVFPSGTHAICPGVAHKLGHQPGNVRYPFEGLRVNPTTESASVVHAKTNSAAHAKETQLCPQMTMMMMMMTTTTMVMIMMMMMIDDDDDDDDDDDHDDDDDGDDDDDDDGGDDDDDDDDDASHRLRFVIFTRTWKRSSGE